MSSPKVLFGFHAVGVRLKTAPQSIIEVYYEATRRDARMRQFLARAKEAGVRLIEADGLRLAKLAGSHGHQGVAARVEEVKDTRTLDVGAGASKIDFPVEWGEYRLDERFADKVLMPLAIQVHHAVCDGFHVCRFLDELQDLLNK